MAEPSIHIVCYEVGSDQPPWVGPSEMLEADLKDLGRLEQAGLIEVDVQGSLTYISGLDRVGLVQLPSGRRLVIRSKIENLVLLEWLAYLDEFPPLDVWLDDPGVTAGCGFHACLARLFLRELDRITRLHFRKDYAPKFLYDLTIRGHIETNQLFRCLHRLPLVPQVRRIRSVDTPYNGVLALALDKLPLVLGSPSQDERDVFVRLQDMWANISRDLPDPVTGVTEAQWACPPGYRAGLQIARMLLIGAALDPESGHGGQAFTLSLSAIWERGLRRMFEDLARDTGWSPVPDGDRTRHWDDAAGRNDPNRWLTVDVMVVHDDIRWVLDAKYKRSFGNESRSDRFQMCAYAVAFDADVASLVYPMATSGYNVRLLLDTSVGQKRVTVDSVSLPMSAGPRTCRAVLLKLSDRVLTNFKAEAHSSQAYA